MSHDLAHLGWDSYFDEQRVALGHNGLLPGRVAREHRERYALLTEAGESHARLSGHYRHRAAGFDEFPSVGDWVLIRPSPQDGDAVIEALLPRRTQFRRQAVLGGRTEAQVIAANIDTVFVVGGLDGDLNPRRIERYLAVAWDGGAMPIVLLNKADLCADIDGAVAGVEARAGAVPVHAVSALNGEGLDALAPYLAPGRTVAFLGSSGTGKSTMVNRLLGEDRQKVEAVREDDSRGRHTTVARELIATPGGAVLIDTPGMRELAPWSDEGGVGEVFHEIEALAPECRFRNCEHMSEPGCAVHAAIETGGLDPDRLRNYRKLKREEAFFARRREQRARMGAKGKRPR